MQTVESLTAPMNALEAFREHSRRIGAIVITEERIDQAETDNEIEIEMYGTVEGNHYRSGATKLRKPLPDRTILLAYIDAMRYAIRLAAAGGHR